MGSPLFRKAVKAVREPYPNELMHYGVLGMKWGIRRYQPYSEKPRGSGKGGKEVGEAKRAAREADRAAKKDRIDAYKNHRNLSDKELNDRINRLQKEKQLKDLTKSDLDTKAITGKEKTNEMFKKYVEFNKPAWNILGKVAMVSIGAVGFYYSKELMTAIFGAAVAAEMVNPFKKKK